MAKKYILSLKIRSGVKNSQADFKLLAEVRGREGPGKTTGFAWQPSCAVICRIRATGTGKAASLFWGGCVKMCILH